jgi:hypothetical protein
MPQFFKSSAWPSQDHTRWTFPGVVRNRPHHTTAARRWSGWPCLPPGPFTMEKHSRVTAKRVPLSWHLGSATGVRDVSGFRSGPGMEPRRVALIEVDVQR